MALIISNSPAETFAIGQQLAESLQAGDVLALCGDLGAGKTQLVKGIAHGLQTPSDVSSPTFTLIHEYVGGRLPLYHIDLYRLETEAEALSTGFEEYLNADGVTAIEWADKFSGLLPREVRQVRIEIGESDTRRIVIEDTP